MNKGFTFVSLVVYIVLFFSFLVIASSITTTLNINNYKDRGYIDVNLEYLKLYSNLFYSAKNSDYFSFDNNEYNFSNGDFYLFDEKNNLIIKNNNILCYNFKSISSNNSNDKNINFDINFLEFDNNINRKIILNVGEGK